MRGLVAVAAALTIAAAPASAQASPFSFGAPVTIDHAAPFQGAQMGAIACPSTTTCLVVDAGALQVSTNVSAGSWAQVPFGPAVNVVYGLACPSVSLCVGTDDL